MLFQLKYERPKIHEISSKEKRKIKKMAIVSLSLWLVVLLGGLALAEETGPVEIVADGCSKEISTYNFIENSMG